MTRPYPPPLRTSQKFRDTDRAVRAAFAQGACGKDADQHAGLRCRVYNHNTSFDASALAAKRPPIFAEQNADPVVMQFITGVLTREESDAYVEKAKMHFAQHGFCKWAVEAPGVVQFIGAVGLKYVKFKAAFTPAVEVAWRLNRRYWGQGYATEAARAAIVDGFDRIGLAEIVSMTALSNVASMKVMERLSMTRAFEFDHPHHPEGDLLRRHVLYRLRRLTPTSR